MVPNFMQHGDTDLFFELLPGRAGSFERTREDRDPVGSYQGVRGVSFGARNPLIQSEQLIIAIKVRVFPVVQRRFFLDDDCHVIEESPHLGRKPGNDTRH